MRLKRLYPSLRLSRGEERDLRPAQTRPSTRDDGDQILEVEHIAGRNRFLCHHSESNGLMKSKERCK